MAAGASVTAEFPNTMPSVAFLQGPILFMKHLKSLVAAQREEVAHFKATLAKP